jgi:glyoxylase-like metal-dependent hydrolase (beta-lactamase superfamily II)
VTEEPDPLEPWWTPVVHLVAPDVYRIPLELPDVGLHSVNVYALTRSDGVTLIDPGQTLAGTNPRLAEALSLVGSSLADVDRILVTHLHRDHYTNAVVLRREHGTPIALGEEEAPSVDEMRRPGRHDLAQQLGLVRQCGAEDLVVELDGFTDGVDPDIWEPPDEWLRPGALALPDRTLDVVPTPGHTRGHVVFDDPERRVSFTGDHVLPHITPSIGFEAAVVPLPLRDYLNSLRLVLARPDAVMLPAHGAVGPSVHRRVAELLDHHAMRLEETWLPLMDASTAQEVAARLRWTRRGRRLEEMSPMNRMLAILETRAHLEVLVQAGRASRAEDPAGVQRYRQA